MNPRTEAGTPLSPGGRGAGVPSCTLLVRHCPEAHRQDMRNATPAKIALGLLGMTAIAAPVMLAAGLALRVKQDGDDACPWRLVSPSGLPPAHAAEPPAHAASRARPAAETAAAAAQMFPGGLARDFGAVPHGTQLLHRFPIINVHAAAVTIAYLQTSCDCIRATAAKRVLQPRESATIDVCLDTRRFTGAAMQNVRVKVVGPDFVSTCKLVVSAVSEADAGLEPAEGHGRRQRLTAR